MTSSRGEVTGDTFGKKEFLLILVVLLSSVLKLLFVVSGGLAKKFSYESAGVNTLGVATTANYLRISSSSSILMSMRYS